MKSLALFDLDETLIAGDSDAGWYNFLCAQGLLSKDMIETNKKFYQDYTRGELDIDKYVFFVAEVMNSINSHDTEQLYAHYLESVIRPIVLPAALELVGMHKERGDYCIIISATNHLTVNKVAPLFGVDLCMATELEWHDGRYTGATVGPATYREGKCEKMNQWLITHSEYSLERASFYSDSANDIPLLNQVKRPVAVDPDDTLRRYASDRGWSIISLR